MVDPRGPYAYFAAHPVAYALSVAGAAAAAVYGTARATAAGAAGRRVLPSLLASSCAVECGLMVLGTERHRRAVSPTRPQRRPSSVAGAAEIGAAVLTAPVSRRWYNRWGASLAETTAAMPGDELVPEPSLGYTRAITIAAPPARVWPWLAQVGQGRGGLYSFDGLENLAGCDIHSVDRLEAAWQELRAGDLIRLGPEGYPCFRVAEVDEPNVLVLLGADPKPPHDVPGEPRTSGATWQWLLRPLDGGSGTRLIVRQRLAYPRGQGLTWRLVEPVAFVMERQMLLGIRSRVERRAGESAST